MIHGAKQTSWKWGDLIWYLKVVYGSQDWAKYVCKGFGRPRPYWMSKANSRLPDVVGRGTQIDPRLEPRPQHVTSPALDTWAIGPTWPPAMSHYIPCVPRLCRKFNHFRIYIGSMLGWPLLSFLKKLIKHIMSLILHQLDGWESSLQMIKKLSS